MFSGASFSNGLLLKVLLFIRVIPVSDLGIEDWSYRTKISDFSSDIPGSF